MDRGQAFTLEGVIGGMVLLAAILFALQSLLVTPTTSGTVDPDVRSELRQQANDILINAAENESFDLSSYVRYYDQNGQRFYNATNRRVGYGSAGPPKSLGTMLNETFTQRGRVYNVELRYLDNETTAESLRTQLVYRSEPSANAVVATYTVTLFDNQTLTAPNAGSAELVDFDTDPQDDDDGYYPIPDAVDGPIYNVVEVRVVVW
ncbi:MAG: hypothetical protein ABEH56_03355 [Salinirussus sp.]